MGKITEENWDYAYYKKSSYEAFLSIGGDLDSCGAPDICYFVTLSRAIRGAGGGELGVDLQQRHFNSLDHACDYLNAQYGTWELQFRLEKEGCSKCH